MTLLVHQRPSATPLEQMALAFQQSTTNESNLKDVSDAYKGPTCFVDVSTAPMEGVISTTDLTMSTLSCLETASQCEVSVDSAALEATSILHGAYQAPFVFQARRKHSTLVWRDKLHRRGQRRLI